MTNTGFVKATIVIFVALGVHFGITILLPGIADAVNYILSGLGGIVGGLAAHWLHLEDPPQEQIL